MFVCFFTYFRYNGKLKVWRLVNERYLPECMKASIKYDKKINVWGCFCWNGVGDLYRIKGTMDADVYHYILQRKMVPSAKKLFDGDAWLFQADNDPKHTAGKNKRYLEYKEINVLDWPSQSPDINPIENLWAILNQSMKERTCNTEDELFNYLHGAWVNLEKNILEKLIISMPERCKKVIENNGNPIGY